MNTRKKLLIFFALAAAFVGLAATGNIRWTQIYSGDRHGSNAYGQSSDGTGTSGNLAKYNSGGGLTDAGGPIPATLSAVSHFFVTAYNSVTGAWTTAQPAFTDLSGSVTLAQHATQAADTVVMNASGSSAAPTAVAMPTSGTNGCAGTSNALTYNTSTHAWGCNSISGGGGTGFTTQHSVAGSRSLGTVYQNTSGGTMFVSVSPVYNGSGGVKAYSDSSNPPTTLVSAGFLSTSGFSDTNVTFMVLNGNYYKVVNVSGSFAGFDSWTEWY